MHCMSFTSGLTSKLLHTQAASWVPGCMLCKIQRQFEYFSVLYTLTLWIHNTNTYSGSALSLQHLGIEFDIHPSWYLFGQLTCGGSEKSHWIFCFVASPVCFRCITPETRPSCPCYISCATYLPFWVFSSSNFTLYTNFSASSSGTKSPRVRIRRTGWP